VPRKGRPWALDHAGEACGFDFERNRLQWEK